jgi:hypothetical protein
LPVVGPLMDKIQNVPQLSALHYAVVKVHMRCVAALVGCKKTDLRFACLVKSMCAYAPSE